MKLFAPTDCGPDGYPPEWHESIKHAVREAAGHRCIRCGHPYEKGAGQWSPCDKHCTHEGPMRTPHEVGGWWTHPSYVDCDELRRRGLAEKMQAQWRILTVHHLNGDKFDCRWWNLVALCQRCHLQIQGKVQMARVWPWDHSEWFKPYAAGFYAFTYLGEDLSREEVEARMDELLNLERAA